MTDSRTARLLVALRAGPRPAVLRALALAWVGALLLLLVMFRLVGEDSWEVVLLLYLPRHPWILPGLALLPYALRRGRRAALLPLAAGGLLWLFPLMGFVAPRPTPAATGPTLRVLSYNTAHAVDGVEGLRELFREARPDLILLQWTGQRAHEALSGPEYAGWSVQRTFQFTVASRYPILSLEAVGTPAGSGPPAAHAVVDTPLGPLDVFDIRPQSAREEVGAQRKLGLRRRVYEFLRGATTGRFDDQAALREAQVRSIAAAAAAARHPVVIAGDTNLPDGSLLLRRYLGRYRDAFSEVGWGLGHTHPSKAPWLRLDRVLHGPELRPVGFRVLARRSSAHLAVVADLERVPGR